VYLSHGARIKLTLEDFVQGMEQSYAAPQDAKQLFDPRGKFAEGTVQDSGEIKQQCRMRKVIKEGRSMQNCIG